eukprot:753049-Hanusia_phi.AAC.4
MGGAMVKGMKRTRIVSTFSSTFYRRSSYDEGSYEPGVLVQQEENTSRSNPEVKRLIAELLQAEATNRLELHDLIEDTARAIRAEIRANPSSQAMGSSSEAVAATASSSPAPQRLQEILETQFEIAKIKREIVEEVRSWCKYCESRRACRNGTRNGKHWSQHSSCLTTRRNCMLSHIPATAPAAVADAGSSSAQVQQASKELETLQAEERDLRGIVNEYKNHIKGILMRQRMIQMVNAQRQLLVLMTFFSEN